MEVLFLHPALGGASSLQKSRASLSAASSHCPGLQLPGVTRTRCSECPSPVEIPSPPWQRSRPSSSPDCPALFGPRANLGSGRATLARLGFKHLLLGSLAPRLQAGGAAVASAVRSWKRGADAPGSSSLHFNSWPLWPLHTEREASCWSRSGGGCRTDAPGCAGWWERCRVETLCLLVRWAVERVSH